MLRNRAAWDCSAWVRTYGLFLEERLECFRVLEYDVEAERLSKQGQGPEKVRDIASRFGWHTASLQIINFEDCNSF